ncbi:MAG: type II toxin-antitoxin system VapC family toxin [Patescibacteria group bacterium]
MKEYNYFVDTNIFLRVLLKDEERTFEDCRQFLKKIKNGDIKAVTSNLVLAEINWTLLKFYKFTKEDAVKSLDSIARLSHLKFIDDFDSILAVKFYKDYQIKFIDALISSIPGISDGKVKIVSYDRDFDKLGDWRIEPKEVIKNKT